jgi:hypothetical protein
LEKLFAIVNGNLSDDNNSSKDISMDRDLLSIPEGCTQNCPILESFVDSFLSATNKVLHSKSLLWVGEAFGALDIPRSVSNIAIISFNSFPRFKMAQERRSKDIDVRVPSTGKRTMDPNNISSLNTKPNFVPEA